MVSRIILHMCRAGPDSWTVDRILRQQKADRQAALAAKAEAEKHTTLLSKPLPALHSESSPRPSMSSSTSTQLAENELAPSIETDGGRPRPTSIVKSSFQNIKQKLGNLQPNRPQSIPGSFSDSGNRLPPPPNTQRSNSPNVTPQSNICEYLRDLIYISLTNHLSLASNIDMAIKACRPEDRNLLQNREMMQQVKESLNEGYCDLSGRIGDLNLLGSWLICLLDLYLILTFTCRRNGKCQSLCSQRLEIYASPFSMS